MSPRVSMLMAIRDKSYITTHVLAATAGTDKERGRGHDGELAAALVVVGLSAEKAAKEAQIRADMIRVGCSSLGVTWAEFRQELG
jgi:hypothetical protein